ncbi:ATP-binding protein [Bacillus alkalicellulosilyticus]|uniref:ATP-binding protein n=1 Tax=Alkalihalobacterium alkalicellulosilyticum TaxID=1912214 RepID=UPI0009986446|nr:ATP-binding protein [Bacillus alkalicellulosilyticus]
MTNILDIEITYIPPKMELEDVMNQIHDSFSSTPFYFTEDFCFAVREALINSLEASKGLSAENQMIFIHATYDNNEAVVEISELGKPFDENRINFSKETTFEDVLYEERGRGLLFINLFTDEFTFTQNYEGLKIFTLRKKG